MSLRLPWSSRFDASIRRDPRRHRVPGIPVVLDGEAVEPAAVLELQDRPLHTVLDPAALAGESLRVFTGIDRARAYALDLASADEAVQSEGPPRPPGSPIRGGSGCRVAGGGTNPLPADAGVVEFYEHIDLGGCGWRVPDSQTGVADLTKVVACGFLWWGWKSADQRISSLDVTTSYSSITLQVTPFPEDGTLWVPHRARVNSLVDYGWNDRARYWFRWCFA
ncbi:hypothetical protein Sru01_09480 [Sphaerisporangium rufum]|uniref:Uncharacterized protein n=1 Tax=Sphaerisporangium rufum TaxID=1381558 RepID=A0A919QXJ9_9ACTN|nr:hypothetical protein [Sphaerisporangium rufum]GII75966.1 hypothetical protein Sru01_09480 [Sphaerisporangium rufum]